MITHALCARVCALGAAEHVLRLAHLATQSSVGKIAISRLSAEDKLPITLQARAREPLKKGSIVLVPAVGEIVPDDDDAKLRMVNVPDDR